MTTLTVPAPTRRSAPFARAARMEWIKLRSLRSTAWALLLTVAGMIAVGVVTMANTKAPSADRAAQFDPTNNVLAGVALGQLVVGVLGVLVVTGEYSCGSIRSTLAAIPDRRTLLAAKAAVYGTVTLVVGEAVALVTFFAGRAALAEGVPRPGIGDPGVLRAVLLAGAYLSLVGLLGIGIGALLRHTASAIAVLVGVTFVLPAVIGGLSGPTVAKFFPTMIAGNSLAVAKPVADMLAPWTGFAVLCLYVAATLGAGARLPAHRDA
ncbi:ABC transporter permease [Streptomyces flavofungini]|uniref:ABC transporter permease n=1 Tax=Streptomyces flavofungini TaxID=68200 RepID=A0ABS0X9Y8_9ACTN|nr:ABC transporter permease [Streptomyces flavofungini]MBJ3810007.1 ABC transporter permease [Streptomyces flavofungini]GHC53479.1 ABC transporter permease [Streptomyces flavofungini]